MYARNVRDKPTHDFRNSRQLRISFIKVPTFVLSYVLRANGKHHIVNLKRIVEYVLTEYCYSSRYNRVRALSYSGSSFYNADVKTAAFRSYE